MKSECQGITLNVAVRLDEVDWKEQQDTGRDKGAENRNGSSISGLYNLMS